MLRSVTLCAVALLSTLAREPVASAQAAPSVPAPAPAAATPEAAPPASAAPAEPAAAVAPTPPAEPLAPPPSAFSPLKLESPNASIRFGLLAQPAFESVGSPTLSGMATNFFVRRIRLLVGGTLFKDFEYFFDTDSANLFKANAEGVKNPGALNVQDAMITGKLAGDAFKIDAGWMLPPLGHNALQGAGTLYGWDYFSNTFRHGAAFGDATGRDAGLEFRGLVADGHFEYRAGMFQGVRRGVNPPAPAAGTMGPPSTDSQSQNMFRMAGRIQVNLLDAETGFFYAGSYLGKKRIFSVGGSYDFQDKYKHWSADAFLDLPVGPGAVTAQVDVGGWDGGTFIAALPKQIAVSAEAGYLVDAISLSPIVRFETRNVTNQTAEVPDETRIAGGLAYWCYGHNVNLKAFVSRINPNPGNGYNAINAQWQLYFY